MRALTKSCEWMFTAVGILLASSFGILVFFSAADPVYFATHSYALRILGAIIPTAFMSILLVSHIINATQIDNCLCRLLGYTSVLFLCIMLTNYIIGGAAFNRYIQDIVKETESSHGFKLVNKTEVVKNPFYWGWTMPSESILAQIREGKKEINCILTLEKSGQWEPYDSFDVMSYPNLEQFNIKYNHEALTLYYP
jgi:hypothetical protein